VKKGYTLGGSIFLLTYVIILGTTGICSDMDLISLLIDWLLSASGNIKLSSVHVNSAMCLFRCNYAFIGFGRVYST
jgi:hypothetical protein